MSNLANQFVDQRSNLDRSDRVCCTEISTAAHRRKRLRHHRNQQITKLKLSLPSLETAHYLAGTSSSALTDPPWAARYRPHLSHVRRAYVHPESPRPSDT